MSDRPPRVVAEAIADLGERLGVGAAEIELVSVEEVDWPDASIGCPQPGMVYRQVLINGSRIVLRHGGVRYDYHQGGRRPVFLCRSAGPRSTWTPGPPPGR